jgi:hypothetical protein
VRRASATALAALLALPAVSHAQGQQAPRDTTPPGGNTSVMRASRCRALVFVNSVVHSTYATASSASIEPSMRELRNESPLTRPPMTVPP